MRELRGFVRVELAPGGSTEVTFQVDARTLASYTYAGEWAVEPGEFAVETGPSSLGTRAARLTVTA